MTDDTLIDAAAIRRLQEWGGDKLVREMIRLYLENAAARLDQIDEGLVEGGDLEHAGRAAHSLKSSALNVGAGRVSRLAAEMERHALGGERDETAALRPSLARELDEARTALTRLVQELPS